MARMCGCGGQCRDLPRCPKGIEPSIISIQRERCGSRGPRIGGGDARPVCAWEKYHVGNCKPHPDDGWGDINWPKPVIMETKPEYDPEIVEDGFGGSWVKCGPGCDMHVVRPGKVQCNCSKNSQSQRNDLRTEGAVERIRRSHDRECGICHYNVNPYCHVAILLRRIDELENR